jgi:hypothetical protein
VVTSTEPLGSSKDIFDIPGEMRSNGFAAVATVYVELGYGCRKDGFSASDNFPATVHGQFDLNGAAIVDTVTAKTSSFYK